MAIRSRLAASLAGVALVFAGGQAFADDYFFHDRYGSSLTLGGGVAGFADSEMRDTTSDGGMWDLRGVIGTRSPLAIEAAYLGSAQAIDALGLDQDAILLGTALEANARVNLIADMELQPFAFVGVAWRRFDLANAENNTSDVEDFDNLFEVPFGAGLAYRFDTGLTLDARAQYRYATREDLIPRQTADGEVDLDSWGVNAAVGYEF